jgi:hypothetical protein
MPIPERVFVPQPRDPNKKHFYISIIKSTLRIGACAIALYTGSIVWLASGFLIAELLGIAEEL